jgi:diaminohydroxyphosphoribosylaminopyrimidine deaminase/5-amino-6-(5-phosphoribosylamino)uracil reductase
VTDPADRDERFMRLALRQARRGRGRTYPNPHVGAVLVKNDRVVATGFHRAAGSDHAEVEALKRAGAEAAGCELFINLEPCNHHGLTGPCAEAVVLAGIKRVVVGMVDPNPLVNGRGLRRLRRAGIEVKHGVLERECCRENEAFFHFMTEGRPHVTFKTAVTLDGRVATRSGHARWVTGERARRAGHRMRAEHQAIVVGVGTVLADDPQLTCRGVAGGADPIRIVVDSDLRTPPRAQVVRAVERSRAPTWVVCTRRAAEQRAGRLRRAAAEIIPVGTKDGRVSIAGMLAALAKRKVISLLLEGGPTLAGSFWQARAVHRLVAFVAPKVLGDPAALPMLAGPAVERLGRAAQLEDLELRRVAPDVMLSARVRYAGKGAG